MCCTFPHASSIYSIVHSATVLAIGSVLLAMLITFDRVLSVLHDCTGRYTPHKFFVFYSLTIDSEVDYDTQLQVHFFLSIARHTRIFDWLATVDSFARLADSNEHDKRWNDFDGTATFMAMIYKLIQLKWQSIDFDDFKSIRRFRNTFTSPIHWARIACTHERTRCSFLILYSHSVYSAHMSSATAP